MMCRLFGTKPLSLIVEPPKRTCNKTFINIIFSTEIFPISLASMCQATSVCDIAAPTAVYYLTAIC